MADQAGDDSDSSTLSSVPSDVEKTSPLTKKQARGPPSPPPESESESESEPPSSGTFPPPSPPPPPPPLVIPPGYTIKPITRTLMPDPTSRDHLALFRTIHYPQTDFPSGQYIDPQAYAVSTRHVPPNVPKEDSPWAAPLGPARTRGETRYRRPEDVVRRLGRVVEEWRAREAEASGDGESEGKAEEGEEEAEGDTTLEGDMTLEGDTTLKGDATLSATDSETLDNSPSVGSRRR